MSIKDGTSTITCRYMGNCDSYKDAFNVIVGAPMDFSCSFRPGTRFGPQKIREVSTGLEEYSVYLDRSLNDIKFFDSGDVELIPGNINDSLDIIGEAAEEIFRDNKFPVFVGGEHLISLPVIKKAFEKYGSDLVIIHFDAHADLRENYIGLKNSHASVMRRVVEFLPGRNIYQLGIRSGTKEEFLFAKKNTNMFRFEVYEPLRKIIKEIGSRPIYVTLDIDVVDPAYANGTGTPEPGGISSNRMIQTVCMLKDLNLIGFDIVEVSPPYDISDRTALLAAKIIREVMLISSS